MPHTDADGLAAGLGAARPGAVCSGGIPAGPWAGALRPGMPLPKGSVAVFDVDHHAPETTPRADQVVVSGDGEQPETSTARSFGGCCPRRPPWLAAVGAFGDLGDPAFALPEFDHQTGSVPPATIELAHAV